MKKLLLASLLTIGASFALTACMNGDYDANPDTNFSNVPNPIAPVNGGGSGGNPCASVNKEPFSAKVGSDEFVADPADPFTFAMQTNLTGPEVLGVQGHVASFQGEETQIVLGITGYSGPKTYAVGGNNVAAIGPSMNPAAQYSSAYGGSGSIIITRDNADTVAGTFYFTVKNSGGASKSICGGYFKMRKQ